MFVVGKIAADIFGRNARKAHEVDGGAETDRSDSECFKFIY